MSNLLHFRCDDETGETLIYHINKETGEPTVQNYSPPIYVSPRTPGPSIKQPAAQPVAKYMNFPKGHVSRTKEFQSLKENILAGSNQISHRMLLIPTVLFFPALICTLLFIFEIYLHVCCHKKNKQLKDSETYYRSPFHVVTSIFCGVCRECDSASKVGQLQDQRRHNYDYFSRGIVI